MNKSLDNVKLDGKRGYRLLGVYGPKASETFIVQKMAGKNWVDVGTLDELKDRVEKE